MTEEVDDRVVQAVKVDYERLLDRESAIDDADRVRYLE